MRLIILSLLWVLSVSTLAAQTAPPAGSDESKIANGDVTDRVVALLGQSESFANLSPTRTRCVFKRCTIAFESRKVAELPVMKASEDFAREAAEHGVRPHLLASTPN